MLNSMERNVELPSISAFVFGSAARLVALSPRRPPPGMERPITLVAAAPASGISTAAQAAIFATTSSLMPIVPNSLRPIDDADNLPDPGVDIADPRGRTSAGAVSVIARSRFGHATWIGLDHRQAVWR